MVSYQSNASEALAHIESILLHNHNTDIKIGMVILTCHNHLIFKHHSGSSKGPQKVLTSKKIQSRMNREHLMCCSSSIFPRVF